MRPVDKVALKVREGHAGERARALKLQPLLDVLALGRVRARVRVRVGGGVRVRVRVSGQGKGKGKWVWVYERTLHGRVGARVCDQGRGERGGEGQLSPGSCGRRHT